MSADPRGRRPVRTATHIPRALQLPIGHRAPPKALAPEPPVVWPPFRAVAIFLVLMILVSGVLYPGAIRIAADLVAPNASDGSTISLGQNITDPALFWLRPSLIDYAAFSGAGSEVPFGPTNPALVNQTEAYLQQYGLANVSVPANLVTPSESGLDPDIYPAAALLQIPRIAFYGNMSQLDLTALVERFIIQPQLGIFGPAYVDVIAGLASFTLVAIVLFAYLLYWLVHPEGG
ncbi:MAG: potassium-transporting ATPase subunit C [Thermoplasmata archaeon]|nr:potassium-transporting ATPase subunit C [Thermoplasmata archaeon]